MIPNKAPPIITIGDGQFKKSKSIKHITTNKIPIILFQLFTASFINRHKILVKSAATAIFIPANAF